MDLRARLVGATSVGAATAATLAGLSPTPTAAEWARAGRALERDVADAADAADDGAGAAEPGASAKLHALALECLRAAVAASPAHDASALFELAGALARAREYEGACECMADVLSRQPWAHEWWRALAQLERAAGRKAEGAHCMLMALRAHPDSEGGRRWAFLRSSCQRLLMPGRFRALNDTRRASAWARAVEAAVARAPAGAVVLDAGEGHGVHAMVALRAGAAAAVRCEPLLPVAARRLARRNAAAWAARASGADGSAEEAGEAARRLAIFPDGCAALHLAPLATAHVAAEVAHRPPLVPPAAEPTAAPRLLARPAAMLLIDTLHADALASGLPAIVADARARGLIEPCLLYTSPSPRD